MIRLYVYGRKLRQTAPEPTYLPKLQSNISPPEMHLEHSFYPWNNPLEPGFKRSQVTEPGMVREDMTWLCINDDFYWCGGG
jgi:hypothetical protein